MRLTSHEAAAIRASALEVFGTGAVVRLFGSRLDDLRRGGDIDLHVQLTEGDAPPEASARFRMLLDRRVGEREYDILVSREGRPMSAIERKAIAEGIIL